MRAQRRKPVTFTCFVAYAGACARARVAANVWRARGRMHVCARSGGNRLPSLVLLLARNVQVAASVCARAWAHACVRAQRRKPVTLACFVAYAEHARARGRMHVCARSGVNLL